MYPLNPLIISVLTECNKLLREMEGKFWVSHYTQLGIPIYWEIHPAFRIELAKIVKPYMSDFGTRYDKDGKREDFLMDIKVVINHTLGKRQIKLCVAMETEIKVGQPNSHVGNNIGGG